jgi:hypothetical protein
MRTHYENLKVAEDAPEEVVRAAYKALSLRHHPDQNGGSDQALRVMQIINAAYEVLGNPTRRAEYDAFLRRSRIAAAPGEPVIVPRRKPQVPTPPAPMAAAAAPMPATSRVQPLGKMVANDFRWAVAIAVILGLIAWSWKNDQKRVRGSSSGGTNTSEGEARSGVPVSGLNGWVPPEVLEIAKPVIHEYRRPATAPNGSPWPSYASYIPRTNVWASGGLSSVTVDNTGCDSDVHVKLKVWRDSQSHDVRECFIPARSQFTFEKVAPGWFDVRYRDLDSGQLAKTESFQLSEIRTASGTNYSDMRLTLYKVASGNMQTTGIPESEF